MNLFRKLSSWVFPQAASRAGIAPPDEVAEPPTVAREPDVVVSAPELVADGYQANPNHSPR